MSPEEFVQKAENLLDGLLDVSGKVLYSAAKTLRPGDLYLMGVNPGGEPDQYDAVSIRQNLARFRDKETCDYLDEQWQTKKGLCRAGEHPLQRNLRYLFDRLPYELSDVCASNLIFTRSKRINGAGYPRNADLCWPVHQLVLEIIQPRVLFVFGNMKRSPFEYLLSKARAENPDAIIEVDEIPSGHGTWVCRSFAAHIEGHRRVVIGVPHLSWYTIKTIKNNDKESVLPWLLRLLSDSHP